MIKQNNENPLSSDWKKRYSELESDIKQRLDALDQMNPKDYQLRVIKNQKLS